MVSAILEMADRQYQSSNYHPSIIKRPASGEAPKRVVSDLEKYLNSNAAEMKI